MFPWLCSLGFRPMTVAPVAASSWLCPLGCDPMAVSPRRPLWWNHDRGVHGSHKSTSQNGLTMTFPFSYSAIGIITGMYSLYLLMRGPQTHSPPSSALQHGHYCGGMSGPFNPWYTVVDSTAETAFQDGGRGGRKPSYFVTTSNVEALVHNRPG